MKTNAFDLIDIPSDETNQVSELTMMDANFSEDTNEVNNDANLPTGVDYLSKIDLTPKQIVQELDRFIIGQNEAKRAIAIALRNRKRRMLLELELRDEVTPKNILMIGPSGVGKTEIGRRAAKITGCPFLKIEATKFTEVGYIGRDVDSIPRDLVDSAFKSLREEEITHLQPQVLEAAESKIIDSFVPPSRPQTKTEAADELKNKEKSIARNVFRKQLRAGLLDDKEIDVELAALPAGVEIMGPPGMEDMTNQLQNMLQNIGTARTRTRRMKVKDALVVIQKEEAGKLLDEEDLKRKAIEWVEQYGIVFIDEIDKVCRRGETSGADVSREGVQRDLLPLIEGCTVSTKYGMVRTDHILFIAAGAFHLSKPSDLVPELQGRLPIRVELKALTAKDFERILIEPQASLIVQYQALLGTEELVLNFDKLAIQRIAEIAYDLNEKTENIGARRLYTVMERLLEEISFEATDYTDKNVNIDVKYVDKHLTPLAQDQDTSHFIL
ncbi:MAG: ATP-dependent HslUV protease ATP-binding subunit HslU [Pseudomonadota bacterium]|jgi:ATP-dependent HslUV protease ATP-binding subunit HslU|nr:ATP-dependent HslUV protease ATP-binding subunit HslU [Pseudomonadota bacterium]